MPRLGLGFAPVPRTGLESTGEIRSNRSRTSVEASAHRVIRGGSWNEVAQHVRAAYRLHYVPSLRSGDLGFRCAEFRQGVVSGARPGSEAKGAEPPVDRDPTSAAALLGEDGGAQPN
jgi:Sulfatase-modifying factor enzyme 1